MQDITDFNNELMQAAQGIAATGLFTADDEDETAYYAVADAVCSAIIANANSTLSVEDLRCDLDYYVNKELFELDC
jgi:hypothetical protein